MNGFSYKTVILINLIASSSISISAQLNNSDIYSAKLGCMSCHAGGAVQTIDPTPKNKFALNNNNRINGFLKPNKKQNNVSKK